MVIEMIRMVRYFFDLFSMTLVLLLCRLLSGLEAALSRRIMLLSLLRCVT